MGTSVTATGITFPDATSQTTAATSAFAAGTVVLFYQAAAPTGWTKQTAIDDYDLRLTSGTGGSTGGTTAYSTVFANQTPTITTSGLSAGATTLSTSQIPSHTHDLYFYNGNNPQRSGTLGNVGPDSVGFYSQSNYNGYTATTTGAGSGGSHTHSISGSATSSAITLNVRYANIIACAKN